jgi:hypothetical protein
MPQWRREMAKLAHMAKRHRGFEEVKAGGHEVSLTLL